MVILRILKKIVVLLFFGVALYFVTAVVLSILPTHPNEPDCETDYTIFITTNGVHLDIVIPVEHLDKELIKQLQISPSTKYVAFGWGDKQFYLKTPTWSDLTFPVAFRAVFLQSETAMHVTSYRNQYRSWTPLEICENQLTEMNRYIENSFETDSHGNIIRLNVQGYSYNDHFYEAKGSFSLFNTCNIWVNKALKRIEVQTSVWSPFDFGILHHLT